MIRIDVKVWIVVARAFLSIILVKITRTWALWLYNIAITLYKTWSIRSLSSWSRLLFEISKICWIKFRFISQKFLIATKSTLLKERIYKRLTPIWLIRLYLLFLYLRNIHLLHYFLCIIFFLNIKSIIRFCLLLNLMFKIHFCIY